jgi:hypothetical protein
MASGPYHDRTHRNRELPSRPPSARTARDILIRVLGAPDRAGQLDLASELLCGVPLPGCAGGKDVILALPVASRPFRYPHRRVARPSRASTAALNSHEHRPRSR